jgi:TonB-dependent receptor
MQASHNRNWSSRSVLVAGASALALAGVAFPAFAQNAPPKDPPKDQPGSEVVVTGYRASLQKSMEIKKNSLGVVDAISAIDIGKFPDANLAEALQRIPGVSVSRGTSSMGGVPTSTGDATEITVRGFGPSFNETLFDGRKIATPVGSTTTTNTREFDFSSVGADFVNQVDILKTPDSVLSDGSIGATINIKFPKPFDKSGLQIVGTASGTVATEDGSITPNVGALISDTFDEDKIGVLVDAHYSDKQTTTHHINIQGWEGTTFDPSQFATAPAGPTNGWFIQDYGIYKEITDDKRYDGRAVVQFRPTENLELTLNDNYARDKMVQNQYGYSVWFNGGSLNNITLSPNGTVTNFVQNNTPTDFQGQINGSVIELNEMGANVKWHLNNAFSVELDYDHSLAKLNPGDQLSSIDADVGYGPSPNGTNGVNIGIAGIGPGQLPYPNAFGPGGDTSRFVNNGIIGSHVLPISSQRNRDLINQVRIGGDWKGDRIEAKAGFEWVQDHKTITAFDDFTNNDWQAYAGYGPASNNPGGVALDQSLFTKTFPTSNFISGFSNGNKLPPNILVYNPYTVLNILQGLGNPQTTNIPGANKNCCSPPFDGTYRIDFVPGGFLDVKETVYAFYFNMSGEGDLGAIPVKYNIGLRAEQTDVSSSGIGRFPTNLSVQPSDHTAFLVTYGDASVVTANNTYRNLLPNLDVTFGLTDTLKLRLDASRTLTRPPLNYITPVSNIPGTQRVGALVATGGNPNLKPYTSDNLDLALEWYYAPNSYAAINGFVKEVNDFIVGGTVQANINGVIDPTTGQKAIFSITSQVNGPAATVYGVELSVQHMFGDTGFGVQANGTIVGTNRPYDQHDIVGSGFAVTGLANSANAVVFWEKYGFSIRGALNWRGEYIDHFGQQQNNSHFGAEPTFVNSNLQFDASASYTFRDNYTVFVEGWNLNNSTYSTHGRFSDQLLDVIEFGPRVTFGARVKF